MTRWWVVVEAVVEAVHLLYMLLAVRVLPEAAVID